MAQSASEPRQAARQRPLQAKARTVALETRQCSQRKRAAHRPPLPQPPCRPRRLREAQPSTEGGRAPAWPPGASALGLGRLRPLGQVPHPACPRLSPPQRRILDLQLPPGQGSARLLVPTLRASPRLPGSRCWETESSPSPNQPLQDTGQRVCTKAGSHSVRQVLETPPFSPRPPAWVRPDLEPGPGAAAGERRTGALGQLRPAWG